MVSKILRNQPSHRAERRVATIIASCVLALAVGVSTSGCAGPLADLLSGNPLRSKSFFVNPFSEAAKAAEAVNEWSSYAATTGFKKLAAQPSGIWLTPEKYSIRTVHETVSRFVHSAARL